MPNRSTLTGTTTSLWAVLIVCLSGLGCSGRPATYPVKGRVQFVSGGPVHVGTVELKSREHSVQARGKIQTDGSFTLTTYEDGDGAVAGLHDCVVVQLVMTEDIAGHRPSVIGVIDPKHASYASSGLVVEILPSGVNEVIVEVDGVRKTQPDSHEH